MNIVSTENIKPQLESEIPAGLGLAILLTLSTLVLSGIIHGATSLV